MIRISHMMNQSKTLPWIMLLIVLLTPGAVSAHSGGLDKLGGHTDHKSGLGYHCHREPCYSNFKKSQTATLAAIKDNRPFSYIYNRSDWKHWSDFDNNCMNTRHEILKAQASGPVRLSPDGCYVSVGIWHDPFSGRIFTRASDLDVDHIVPLKWAHDHGGAKWSIRKKELFANDPINLLAVDDGLNQSKGASGPDEWMPPNHQFRCQYLEKWFQVLNKYTDLTLTASEHRIINRQVQACTSH